MFQCVSILFIPVTALVMVCLHFRHDSGDEFID